MRVRKYKEKVGKKIDVSKKQSTRVKTKMKQSTRAEKTRAKPVNVQRGQKCGAG